jgi:hypothetical protein
VRGRKRSLTVAARSAQAGSWSVSSLCRLLADSGDQQTLTPAELKKKYGWKNDPERVRLLGK